MDVHGEPDEDVVTQFLQYTVLGIVTGAVYAIAATGLVVTYSTSGIFNIAHGAIGLAQRDGDEPGAGRLAEQIADRRCGAVRRSGRITPAAQGIGDAASAFARVGHDADQRAGAGEPRRPGECPTSPVCPVR